MSSNRATRVEDARSLKVHSVDAKLHRIAQPEMAQGNGHTLPSSTCCDGGWRDRSHLIHHRHARKGHDGIRQAAPRQAYRRPRNGRIIRVRRHFFGGLQENAIGEALGNSLATVERDLVFGPAWLLKHIAGNAIA